MDFTKLRLFGTSLEDAFEEFVCQVVHRTETAGNRTWNRLDGAGGDGGVEAHWFDGANRKIGLQAKCFMKTGDIGWDQIKKSFRTAIKIHPDLEEYRYYLACDLTGPTGRKGKSGTELWEVTKTALAKEAEIAGLEVEIVRVTKSELLSQLAKPECIGLESFWFGKIEINPSQLGSWLDKSVLALGDRYHPEDHVETATQAAVRALARCPTVGDGLVKRFAALDKKDRPNVPSAWGNRASLDRHLDSIQATLDSTRDWAGVIQGNGSTSWPCHAWAEALEQLHSACWSLIEASRKIETEDETQKLAMQSLRARLQPIAGTASNIADDLRSVAMAAEESRALLVSGPAGSGKSHLLAECASEILKRQGVSILLLGHHFSGADVAGHIGRALDAPLSSLEEILGALDAAAEAQRTRGIIIVDALNESRPRGLWSRELTPLLNAVRRWPNLGIVVSCRDTYEHQIFSPDVLQQAPRLYFDGFTSDELEKAAQVYLDQRGITRPQAPWLAPELANPLFLRSCATALSARGVKSFPVGRRGTRALLKDYLDAVALTLAPGEEGRTDLQKPVRNAMLELASSMAQSGTDAVPRSLANAMIDGAFCGYSVPSNETWIEALLRHGVIRLDPADSFDKTDDPLAEPEDVVRFAFQRFQEWLVAEAMLESPNDLSAAFKQDGQFGILFHDNGHLRWEYAGLLEALFAIVAERTPGTELVDLLPGGSEKQWNNHIVEKAFTESLKWRSAEAISERSLDLVNQLKGGLTSILGVLVPLAANPEHPWNAEFLDKNLRRWKMPERDARWTVAINQASDDAHHPLSHLSAWCLLAPKEKAEREVLRLSALCLSWALTSSARPVRDQATKALASLLLNDLSLFGELVTRFSNVDDPHVIERVLAAGYGSLLREPTEEKAKVFSKAIWRDIFAADRVPLDLLARDYAVGIIEVADRLRCLPAEIDLAKTRAPFVSKPPVLNASRKLVAKSAERVGGSEILHSCTAHEDFCEYEVRGAVSKFTKVRLTDPAPLEPRDRAEAFERDVVEGRPELIAALANVATLLRESAMPLVKVNDPTGTDIGMTISIPEPAPEQKRNITRAVQRFETLLTAEELQRFRTDWLAYERRRSIDPGKQLAKHNGSAAALWIARRAYALGWNSKLFPNDTGFVGSSYTRDRPRVERIGKKYQWIARAELLARLADNFWMHESFDGPKAYQNIGDLSYERDIDPTVFETRSSVNGNTVGKKLGLLDDLSTAPDVEAVPAQERSEWPFADDLAERALAAVQVRAADGQNWYRLSWYQSVDSSERRSDDERGVLGLSEFFFLDVVLCRRRDGAKLLAAMRDKIVDQHDWRGNGDYRSEFLHERRLRSLAPVAKWQTAFRQQSPTFEFCSPIESYQWESHRDASLQEGEGADIPASWLLQEQDLAIDSRCPQIIRDAAGEMVFWSQVRVDEGPKAYGILVRADWFSAYLAQQDLEPVWFCHAERRAAPLSIAPGTAFIRAEKRGRFVDVSGKVHEESSVDDFRGDI